MLDELLVLKAVSSHKTIEVADKEAEPRSVRLQPVEMLKAVADIAPPMFNTLLLAKVTGPAEAVHYTFPICCWS